MKKITFLLFLVLVLGISFTFPGICFSQVNPYIDRVRVNGVLINEDGSEYAYVPPGSNVDIEIEVDRNSGDTWYGHGQLVVQVNDYYNEPERVDENGFDYPPFPSYESPQTDGIFEPGDWKYDKYGNKAYLNNEISIEFEEKNWGSGEDNVAEIRLVAPNSGYLEFCARATFSDDPGWNIIASDPSGYTGDKDIQGYNVYCYRVYVLDAPDLWSVYLSTDPKQVDQNGAKLTATYRIENPNDVEMTACLGMSVGRNDNWINDTNDDVCVNLLPGVRYYTRYFDFPSDQPSGDYVVWYSVREDFTTGAEFYDEIKSADLTVVETASCGFIHPELCPQLGAVCLQDGTLCTDAFSIGNNIYCKDSGYITVCSGGCVEGACPHEYKACYDNDVYWYDKDNQRQEMVEDCGIDSCSSIGSPYCSNGDVYQDKECYYRGCVGASCYNTKDITSNIVEDCLYGCSGGVCNDLSVTTGNFGGYVTDSNTGNAIGSASIQLGGNTATTNSNGYYYFSNITAGEYTLKISASGHTNITQFVSVVANSSTSHNVVLEPVITTGDIEGYITDKDTGDPIDGVEVVLGFFVATTNDDGYFSFEDVEEGGYWLTIQFDGYEDSSEYVEIVANTSIQHNIELKPVVIVDPIPQIDDVFYWHIDLTDDDPLLSAQYVYLFNQLLAINKDVMENLDYSMLDGITEADLRASNSKPNYWISDFVELYDGKKFKVEARMVKMKVMNAIQGESGKIVYFPEWVFTDKRIGSSETQYGPIRYHLENNFFLHVEYGNVDYPIDNNGNKIRNAFLKTYNSFITKDNKHYKIVENYKIELHNIHDKIEVNNFEVEHFKSGVTELRSSVKNGNLVVSTNAVLQPVYDGGEVVTWSQFIDNYDSLTSTSTINIDTIEYLGDLAEKAKTTNPELAYGSNTLTEAKVILQETGDTMKFNRITGETGTKLKISRGFYKVAGDLADDTFRVLEHASLYLFYEDLSNNIQEDDYSGGLCGVGSFFASTYAGMYTAAAGSVYVCGGTGPWFPACEVGAIVVGGVAGAVTYEITNEACINVLEFTVDGVKVVFRDKDAQGVYQYGGYTPYIIEPVIPEEDVAEILPPPDSTISSQNLIEDLIITQEGKLIKTNSSTGTEIKLGFQPSSVFDDTYVKINEVIVDTTMDDGHIVGIPFQLLPEGIVFDVPAELEIEIPEQYVDDPNDLTMRHYDETEFRWLEMPQELNVIYNEELGVYNVSVLVDHFSVYGVGKSSMSDNNDQEDPDPNTPSPGSNGGGSSGGGSGVGSQTTTGNSSSSGGGGSDTGGGCAMSINPDQADHTIPLFVMLFLITWMIRNIHLNKVRFLF